MYQLVNASVSVTQASQPSQRQRQAMMVFNDISTIVTVGSTAFIASYEDAVDAGYSADNLVAFKAFFDNCTNNGVTVFSAASGATGVADFTTWFTANRTAAYFVLVPADWYALDEFATLVGSYKGDTDQVYFFVLISDFTASGYATSDWVANSLGLKSVMGFMQNPEATDERPDAAAFGAAASYGNFSTSNQMTPLRCTFVENQTEYDVSSTLSTLAQTYNLNWIDSSLNTAGFDAQIIANGVFGNGKNFSYWYGIDWCQENLPLALNAALINGANDPSNPLFYNQNGIDRLKSVIVGVLNEALSYSLISDYSVTATAFSDLSDSVVASGIYSGFAIKVRVQNEFKKLNIGINFTELTIA